MSKRNCDASRSKTIDYTCGSKSKGGKVRKGRKSPRYQKISDCDNHYCDCEDQKTLIAIKLENKAMQSKIIEMAGLLRNYEKDITNHIEGIAINALSDEGFGSRD